MAVSNVSFGGGYIITQPNALSVTAEATLYTPGTGNRFRLTGLIIAASATGVLLLKDNTGGTTIFTLPLTAGSLVILDLGEGLLSGAANRVLTATLSVAGTISGTVWGKDEVPD